MSAASLRVDRALRRDAELAEALGAHDEAEAALRAASARELLRKAYALTHQMHGLGHTSSAARDRFRAMRDLIDAELLRRIPEDQS